MLVFGGVKFQDPVMNQSVLHGSCHQGFPRYHRGFLDLPPEEFQAEASQGKDWVKREVGDVGRYELLLLVLKLQCSKYTTCIQIRTVFLWQICHTTMGNIAAVPLSETGVCGKHTMNCAACV